MAKQEYRIHLARFPFVEVPHYKIRPVAVISHPIGAHQIVTVVPISTKLHTEDIDIVLSDWQRANLLQRSVARVHRMAALPSSLLVSELGQLSMADSEAVRCSLRQLFDLD